MLWVISNDIEKIRKYIENGFLAFPSEGELRERLKRGENLKVIASYNPPEWCRNVFIIREIDKDIFTSQERKYLLKKPELEKELLERKYNLRIFKPNVSLKDLRGMRKIEEFVKTLRNFEIGSLFYPKSVMLVGVAGTGKSFSLKAVAGELGYYVADLALVELLEKPNPISILERILKFLEGKRIKTILWVDEVDKVFAHSGVEELMNKLLTVLQEWNETSYFVKGFWWFTANNLKILKDKFPEFLRSERQDYLWFVDYPTIKDAKDIATLYFEKFYFAPCQKIGREEKVVKKVQEEAEKKMEGFIESFLEFLMEKTAPYKIDGTIEGGRIVLTPAEIKTFIKLMAKESFMGGEFDFSKEKMERVFSSINPVIDIARDTIKYIRSQRNIFKPLN